jgi:hypothetical protein
MPQPIFLALIILGVSIGLLLIYAAFLYEDEQGKIQSVMEDTWARVNDLRAKALGWHTAFIRAISEKITAGFDKVFGKKLFSLQSLTVSICYAVAWFWLAIIILSLWTKPADFPFSLFLPMTFFVVYATLPATIKQEKWQLVWFFVFLTLAYSEVIGPLVARIINFYQSGKPHLGSFGILMVLSAAIGLGFFVLTIVLLRETLRRISKTEPFFKMGLLLFVNVVPYLILRGFLYLTLATLDSLPYTPGLETIFATWGSSFSMALVLILFALFAINFIFVFVSVLIVMSFVVTMILHRFFWPFPQRVLYVLRTTKVIKRRRLLFVSGAVLISYCIGKSGWILKLIEVFNPF